MTPDEITDTVTRLADLLMRINTLTVEADALKRDLRFGVGPVSDMPVGAWRLSVVPSRRFDPATARRVLAPDVLASCSRTTVDSALARKVLSPDQYRQCQTEGALAVRIA
jgi:hypothetical protein